MTHQEILTKAIEKAIAGGYHTWDFNDKYTEDDELEYLLGTLYDDPEENGNVQSVEALIFNHSFAKALWGEKDLMLITEDNSWKQPWQYHLQQMVVAEDPIAYLGKNI